LTPDGDRLAFMHETPLRVPPRPESHRRRRRSKDGWVSLFDGKSLDGWKANEHPQTFSVKDGEIVAGRPGPSLLCWAGGKHEFKTLSSRPT
jgi:hypothetical protein